VQCWDWSRSFIGPVSLTEKWRKIIERKRGTGFRICSSWSRHKPITRFCEHVNEPSWPIKDVEIPNWVTNSYCSEVQLQLQTTSYQLILQSMLHLSTEPRKNGIPTSACHNPLTWCSLTEFHKPQFPPTQGTHTAVAYFPIFTHTQQKILYTVISFYYISGRKGNIVYTQFPCWEFGLSAE
jgi:hypothetical protein